MQRKWGLTAAQNRSSGRTHRPPTGREGSHRHGLRFGHKNRHPKWQRSRLRSAMNKSLGREFDVLSDMSPVTGATTIPKAAHNHLLQRIETCGASY